MIFKKRSREKNTALENTTNKVFPLVDGENLLPALPSQRKEIIWQLHRDFIYRYELVRHRMNFDDYIEVGRTVSFLKFIHFLGFSGVFGSMNDEEFKEHCDTIQKALDEMNFKYPELK